ncbi:MAG TPA: hypothetical protein VIF62_09450 [Labilithrix sp.]|jgi:hypothetical protein
MSRERKFAGVLVAAFGAAAIACSGGSSASNTNDTASHSKHGSSDTNNDDPGTSPEPGSTSMPSSTPPPPPATDGGADSGTNKPPPGGPMCAAIPTCASTQPLSAIAGDSGGESKATAAGSEWLTIRVQEQSTSSMALSIDALLTPPAGAEYELHVYQDDCKTELAAPTVNDDGTIEVYSSWDDRDFLDDGKNVKIEVRYKSGSCDVGSKWILDVMGGL